MVSGKYITAFCKECGEPIYKGDGKVVKGGFWICTACLILCEIQSEKKKKC